MSTQLSLHTDMARQSVKAASLQLQPKDAEKVSIGGKVKTSETGLNWEDDKIKLQDAGDTAVLTSTVSVSHEGKNPGVSIFGIPLSRKTLDNLMDSYKSAFRGSHSHNEMLERFMQGMAANALVLALSTMDVSTKEIQSIQTSIREEAVKEIDGRISSDWANAKAMMEIVG